MIFEYIRFKWRQRQLSKMPTRPYYFFCGRALALDRHELLKELSARGIDVSDADTDKELRSRLARLYSHEWHIEEMKKWMIIK